MTNNKATVARPKNAPSSKQQQTSAKSIPKASKHSGQHPPKQYARQKKSNQQQQQQPSKPHVTKATTTTAAQAPTTASPSPRSNKKSKQEWDVLKNQKPVSKHQQQRKPNVMSSKARRVERKRDIASMTDAIQSLDLSSSPPCSSSDSENSDAIQVSNKKKLNKQRSTTMSKPGPAAFPPLKRNQQRRSNNNNNNNATTSSAAKVYCGPCFSNAPAPSALPIPAFNPSSPTSYQQQPYVHPTTYDHDGVFAIEDYSLQQQSQQLMSLLTPRHPQPHQPMMPATMMTGHHPHPDTTEQTLSEIQRGLRSMLKIST